MEVGDVGENCAGVVRQKARRIGHLLSKQRCHLLPLFSVCEVFREKI
jgi:hypothetical protein